MLERMQWMGGGGEEFLLLYAENLSSIMKGCEALTKLEQ